LEAADTDLSALFTVDARTEVVDHNRGGFGVHSSTLASRANLEAPLGEDGDALWP
jgi:hypothetical protein